VKEEKPTNGDLAVGVAVLRYAADLWGEDLFLFSEDFKAWLNQFGAHPSESFKTCFLWLHRDADGVLIPTWVMECVMGFGMYPSSGIAQRFSHALMWITFRRFGATEAALLDAEMGPRRVQSLQDRAALSPNQRVLWDADCYTDDT
jgi:hypothetical protein